MSATMTRQECDTLLFQSADDESVRGTAKGRVYGYLFDVAQLRHLVKTATADDSNGRLFHFFSFVSLDLLAAT